MNNTNNKQKKPNLIYVFADQLRLQSCGYMGDNVAHTPNIDKLAENGISLVNAVSVTPVCCPYRASLFSGQYTSSTGMVINELRARTNFTSFAQTLNNHGYKSAYIGKWHLWADTKKEIVNNKVIFHENEKNQFVPIGKNRMGFDDYWASFNFNHNYYKGFYYTDTMEKKKIEEYEPDFLTNLAINYMSEKAHNEEPFNLFLSLGTPHQPWRWDNVPEKFAKMYMNTDFPYPPNYEEGSGEYWHKWYDKKWWKDTIEPNLKMYMQVYYAMTANLDWNVGRIVEAVKNLGLSENTIIVFTSDHGEMFGAHGRVQKNIFYDEAVRVPFIVNWNGKIPEASQSDVCLNTPDIMPTILSLMDIPIPDGVEGMDLSHALVGTKGPEPEAAFMQGMGPSVDWDDGFEWRALRDKRYTYAVMKKDNSEFLFDNQNDPYQMNNLISNEEYSEVAKRFRFMLKERMSEIKDTFEPLSWYRKNWIEDDTFIVRSAKDFD